MAATTIAARLINQGMHDTKWEMEVIEPGELRLTHYSPNLVSAAYANLGALISKKKVGFKECPGCGRVFLPRSGKQSTMTRNAPPGPGSADGSVTRLRTSDFIEFIRGSNGSNVAAIDTRTHPDALGCAAP